MKEEYREILDAGIRKTGTSKDCQEFCLKSFQPRFGGIQGNKLHG